MPMTCPHCLQDDLRDRAKRCHHCGQPTDPAAEADRLAAERKAFREEISKDLGAHYGLLDRAMQNIKTFGIVVVAVAGAVFFFLAWDTQKNVREVREQIATSASREIQTAADDVKANAQAEIARKINEFLDSPEFTDMLQTTISGAVKGAVEEAVRERTRDIEQQLARDLEELQERTRQRLERVTQEAVADVNNRVERIALEAEQASDQRLDAAIAAIESGLTARTAEIDARIDSAVTDLDRTLEKLASVQSQVEDFRTGFDRTREQRVQDSLVVLPLDPLRLYGKVDLGEIPSYLEARVEALSFQLRDFYDGPITWKYMERLSSLPEFRFVILYEDDGETLFGLYSVAALKGRFDPPDQARLRVEFGDDPWAVPNRDGVPGWAEFAERIAAGDEDWLRSLPSFQSRDDAIPANKSSVEALIEMDRLRVDQLPVVDEGRFVGITDRSRLTSGLLIELAAGPR